jgi:hypothetical protein
MTNFLADDRDGNDGLIGNGHAPANAPTGAASNDNDDAGAGVSGFDMLIGDASDHFTFGPAIGAPETGFVSDLDATPPSGEDFLDLTVYGIDPVEIAHQVTLAADGGDVAVTVDASHVIFLFGATGSGDGDVTHSDFLL